MRTVSRPLWILVFATALSAADAARGKTVFYPCGSCHNTLTDARKAGPSLRTLFGKVRLINGKRVTDENVIALIMDGYNGMPSYRYQIQPDDQHDLLAYLKTLRGRPEFPPVLPMVRGTDAEILKEGEEHFAAQCKGCHDAAALQAMYQHGMFANGARVQDAVVLALIREGHSGASAVARDDRGLFSLFAYLKARSRKL
jgi:mono/diheme cytochrome c family protein